MRAMVKILVLHAMAIQWLVVLRYGVPHCMWVSREKIALLTHSSRLADSLRLHDGVVGVVNWGSLGLRNGAGSWESPTVVTVQGSPASCASKKQVAPVVLVSRGLLNTCWKPQ